ncbi:MAG TPA: histidine kinase [Thermoanaerobaculia bacterium]|nr:histidine kinase [Thermoanaerobaculia bacterium]
MSQWRPVLLAIAAVAVAAAGASTLLLMRDGMAVESALMLSIGPSVLFGFIGVAARYPCRAMPLRSTSTTRILLVHAGGAVVASAVWLAVWNAWTPSVDSTTMFALGVALYALTVTMHYLLLELDTSRQAEEAVLRYRVLAREAELKAFKAQVDPHFLFNSLNAVASLCGSRPDEARQMAQLMADFFRQTLRLGAQERISLEQELDLVSRYMAIERVRFGDRLAVNIHINDAARQWQVPPLLLQPLAENAVRHGIASMVSGGAVDVSAVAEGGLLRIRIENPADPDRPAGGGEGIGLANARGRLAAISGGRARLQTSEAGGRYRVDIEVPA